MSRRSRKSALASISFILLGLIASGLSGCKGPNATQTEEAMLMLSFGSRGRAFAPSAAAVSTYSVTAMGPSGAAAASSSTEASQTLRLAPGKWSILVEGLATDGRRLVSGSIDLDLAPGEKQSATVVLLPEGGNGSISLSWSTVGDPGGVVAVSGELFAAEKPPIAVSGSGVSGAIVLSDVPSGTWSLSLALENEGGKVAGLADSVLVVAGSETAVTVVFEPPNGSLTLSLVGPSFAAETLAALPPIRHVAIGQEARYVVPQGTGSGNWYRNGTAVSSEYGEVAIVAQSEGEERLDWVSTEPYSAKSARARLVASPPVSFGPLSWCETVLRADFSGADSAKGLDGCRDLVFAPDASAIVLAAKDGNAVGTIALAAGRSPIPPVSLLAADFPNLASASLVASVPGTGTFLALGQGTGAVVSLTRAADGSLVAGSSLALPEFITATALKTAPDGHAAWIASEGGDSAMRVELSNSGEPLSALAAIAAGDPGFELLDRPTALALSPDGATLVLGSSGDDSLWFCSLDASGRPALSARITKADLAAIASLSDPVDLIFSPDGSSLYVLSYYGKSIIRMDRDADGSWTATAAVKSGVAPARGFDYPKRLALSPDGNLLVVSGGGGADGLAAFSTGTRGRLDWLGAVLPDGTEGHPVKPGAISFSPDGTSLVAVCPESDSLYLFRNSLP